MKLAIEFLKAIGHTDRTYIRCLSPKKTPLSELESRGMTHKDKSDKVWISTICGYIDLQTGEFYRRYGKEYKPVIDGWGHLLELNKQGYGVYFVVGHGGEKNDNISHGSVLFHESDRASLEQQQLEIDRITQEFGKPTAVVQTKKSLHSYWASEIIRIDNLATYQRRWLQYSNCDDSSLDDRSQLMRLPGFNHVSWNGKDFDRIECKLIQLNEVKYSLVEFDRVLPALDIDRWCQQSISHLTESDADDRDMRSLVQYLPGFDSSGKWIKAKCPAHDGDSSDSLHIDSETGGFICHAGCSSSAVYNASKAVAVANGHRFEVKLRVSEDFTRLLTKSTYEPSSSLPPELKKLIQAEADRWSIPTIVYISMLLTVVLSLAKPETCFCVRETKGKPILWVGIVGSSNSGKSEAKKTITLPLVALQRGANEEYESALVEYERELASYEKRKKQKDSDPGEKPQPIACREFYADDYTYESLAYICQQQKTRCLLLKIDELKGFFEFEKYGTSNNRPRMLSLYDGSEMKVNRKNSPRIHIEKTGISLIGTTQYTTLSRLLEQDDNKEDGLWARLVFINLPTTPTYSHDPVDDNLLYTELARLYAKVNSYTHQTFGATQDTKDLWSEWHDRMVNRSIEQSDGLLESLYGKAKDRVARIALALHLLYAAAEDKEPESEVSASTMKHAIELGKCFLLETEKALALTGTNTPIDPDEKRILKFINDFTGKGFVDAYQIRNWWTTKPKPDIKKIREFMAKVVSLGYATPNDESSESTKYKIKIPEKGSQSSQKHQVDNPQTVTEQKIQGLTTTSSKSSQRFNEYIDENVSDNKFQELTTALSKSSQIGSDEAFVPPDGRTRSAPPRRSNGESQNKLTTLTTEGSQLLKPLSGKDLNIESQIELTTDSTDGSQTLKASSAEDLNGINTTHLTTLTTFSKNSDLKIGGLYLLNRDRTISLDSIDKDGIVFSEPSGVGYAYFNQISSLTPLNPEPNSEIITDW